MLSKKFQYNKVYLIFAFMITFFLMGNVTYIDAQSKSSAAFSSIQRGLKGIDTHASIHLDFILVGTVIAGETNRYAIIMDETTGKQGMYRSGESIKKATVLKIYTESIIVEEDGSTQVLRITGGSSTTTASRSVMMKGNAPPLNDASENLPYFEPVISETGPPISENVSATRPSNIAPITNHTGPPIIGADYHNHNNLPEFVPSISYMGPPE